MNASLRVSLSFVGILVAKAMRRFPLILLIAGLWLCMSPPQSYVLIGLLLWLYTKLLKHRPATARKPLDAGP
jgi:hypothetical protein